MTITGCKQLIQTMRDALDAVMSKVPMDHADTGIKGALGRIDFARCRARPEQNHDSLVAASDQMAPSDYLGTHLAEELTWQRNYSGEA